MHFEMILYFPFYGNRNLNKKLVRHPCKKNTEHINLLYTLSFTREISMFRNLFTNVSPLLDLFVITFIIFKVLNPPKIEKPSKNIT